MRRLFGRLIMAVVICSFLINFLCCRQLISSANAVNLFFIGTVTGEEGMPYYYYSSPEEDATHALGYFYPGAQVYIIDYGEEWCHIFLAKEGYIKTSVLSISQSYGKLQSIGFAFAKFSLDDPAVDPNGFIESLCDCDTSQPGDVVSNGMPLQLIGYAGDMIQVQIGNYDGFIRKRHASIITDQELMLYKNGHRQYSAGTYRVGAELATGLYSASGKGEIVIENRDGKELRYKLDPNKSAAYTVYIPENTTVSISDCSVLSAFTFTTIPEEPPTRGRLLSGVDIEGPPEGYYTVKAEDTEGAYYIISTLWNDKMLECGEKHELIPNEEKTVRVLDGEFIELHSCFLIINTLKEGFPA